MKIIYNHYVSAFFVISVLVYLGQLNESAALSPSFSRQVVHDDTEDLLNMSNLNESNSCLTDIIDIKGITYISDGHTLNATIWIDAITSVPEIMLMRQDTVKNIISNIGGYAPSENRFETNIEYYMLVDVPSIYDKGTDYSIVIRYNNTSHQWDRIFYEMSPFGSRIIDIKYDYKDFMNGDFMKNFESNTRFNSQNYIEFSLDLGKLNYPEKYKIIFGSQMKMLSIPKYDYCRMSDVSELLSIPNPKYHINPIINHPLTLHPNDKTNLEAQISSISEISTVFNLYSIQNEWINVTVSPNIIYLGPNEKLISNVKIETKNAPAGIYTIPLFANATISEDVKVNQLESKFNFTNVSPNIVEIASQNEINQSGMETIFSRPAKSFIPITSNLTITVENMPPWYQGPIDTLNIIGGPLTPIATAVTIISGILGLNIWNRKKMNRKGIKQKPNNKKR